MATRKLPKEPEILERIRKVRMHLGDTDRVDHVRETEDWEKQAKNALIILSLKGHEGVTMIIDKAKKEIRAINWELAGDKGKQETFSYDPHLLISQQLQREDLLKMRRLWEWFLGIFGEAQENIDRITSQLDLEEADPTEEDS